MQQIFGLTVYAVDICTREIDLNAKLTNYSSSSKNKNKIKTNMFALPEDKPEM